MESPTRTGETSDGIPIAAGAGDQAAGALGVGVDRPGPLSVVLGTSGVVFAAQDAYGADPEGRVHAFCHAIPETWHAMGVMLSAAGALAWLRDVAAPGTDFETLVASAEGWEPGAEGLTFLPYLAGERTPHADPDARGAFAGLSLRHDRGALVRAVLEGVAYGLRDSLDLLRDVGAPAEIGRVSGGGARSDLWLRIVASVLELPLQRVAVQEGAAYGAALLGGVAGGVFADPCGGRRRLRAARRGHRAGPRMDRRLRRGARAVPRAVSGAQGRGRGGSILTGDHVCPASGEPPLRRALRRHRAGDRQHAARRAEAHVPEARRPHLGQARVAQPHRFRQGPRGARPHRGCRGAWADPARPDHPRTDVGEHRDLPRDDLPAQGIRTQGCHARQRHP